MINLTAHAEDKRKQAYLPLNIQLFAEGDDDGGEETPPGDDAPPEPKVVTMTQDELNALISKSKAQAKKPYADYDELKTKLSDYEKAEAERKLAEMSETERLQTEVDAAKKAAEDADNRAKQSVDKTNQRLLKAEFKSLALDAGLRKDAIDDAYVLADKSGFVVGDEGDITGVKEALEALVASKPYLVEKAKPRQIGDANNPPPSNEKTKEQRLKDAFDIAKKSGRVEDRAAYSILKRELNG